MRDILSGIYHNDLDDLQMKAAFAEPCTLAEQKILNRLKNLNFEKAEELHNRIYTLMQEQSASAFCAGTRFGAQLMIQLLWDDSNNFQISREKDRIL